MIDYTFRYGDLEVFLLIFVRVLAFVYVAPFFNTDGIPQRIKIGFSLLFSILLYGAVPLETLDYNTPVGYAVIVIKEIVTGWLIGYAAKLCQAITAFAGNIVDMQTGLSMATIMDPGTRENITITAALYQQVLAIMLILSGMYKYLIGALADTFTLIPLNGAVLRTDELMQSFLDFVSGYIVIGFRICLPVFVVTFVINVMLGVMAKVAPQLNMFAVGMQIKVIIGLMILYLTAGMMYQASDFIFVNMRELMNAFASAITPE
ncbi:MAG: flagellar biosynthetic protein FliR [Butyrivibrio sp.]|nr:flagellar biosynthetic protein FliR [Butyrivibrio sp.]